MVSHLVSRFSRWTLALVLLAVLALSLAQPVSAATPSFTVVAVKADELVTVRTQDFPANVNFTIRMDKAGNAAVDGIVVGQTNSGIGGVFETSYRIPVELRGVQTIAIRFESSQGYYAYTWFNNRTQGTTTTPATPSNPVPVTGSKPSLSFLGVKSNDSVTVEARNLPANTSFTVRVGPYYTFFRDYVTMPSMISDANGYARWTILLPDVVMDENMVTVRIDGGGRYAFNAFKNVDNGWVDTSSPSIPVTSNAACQVISVTPGSAIMARNEFDAVWTVKNTSGKTWSVNTLDYKYVSGSKLHKRAARYDLNQEVKPGDTVKIVVDMVAPVETGWYNTNWTLVQNSTTLCNLGLTLRVR